MFAIVPPSLVYQWLLPYTDVQNPEVIDHLVVSGSYPSLNDLLYAIPVALLFGLMRLILQSLLFRPIAITAMKLKYSKQVKNLLYDDLLRTFGKVLPNTEKLQVLCKLRQIDEGKMKKYVWNKRLDRSNDLKLVKFTEALWRFIFYSGFTILGYYSLFVPEPVEWVRDTKQHWMGWPFNTVPITVHYYYLIELGCYIHQLMWTEVTRSDALEMILHHIITIALIVLSYLTRFSRIGSSILLVHDFADIFLEAGKCLNYTSKAQGKQNGFLSVVVDMIFAAFAISFFVTRLVIFPRYLLYSLLVEAPAILSPGGVWPGYWAFAGLLVALQCLHVFWFWLILKMAWRLCCSGESIEKDVRSDDDEDLLEDEDRSKAQKID